MPQALSGVAVRPSLYGAIVGWIDNLSRTLGGWIAITRPTEAERVTHWLLFAAILSGGTIVRFWGLGGVGLHGDEETMAMAVSHMLIDGTPTLPSGMFYPRGLSQQYLMVASVSLFGASEWALRLPSAVCGVLLIPVAFLLGRRFLRPHWNVAFVASVAFLPEFVVYSQTARMYVCLLLAVAISIACVFQWERSGRLAWLAIGILAMIIGIELHALAAFSSLVFLMPGIVRGDRRKIVLGCIATSCVLSGYLLIDLWVNSQYPVPPSDYASDLPPPTWREGPSGNSFGIVQYVLVLIVGLVAFIGALNTIAPIKHRPSGIAVGVLAVATVGLQLLRLYHLAAITMTITCVLAIRLEVGRIPRALVGFVLVSGVLALLQAAVLYAGGIHSITKLIGAMIGRPSIWPYARVAGYSEVAALLCAAMTVGALIQFARRRLIADYVVLAVLTIAIPLFVMGLFLWDLPVRYTVGSAVPLLLCGLAFAQSVVNVISRAWRLEQQARVHAIAAGITAILVINPPVLARVVNPGYDINPDHKGAAEFIRTLNITPDDIVIAEDVLQQTYYLGHVDYWLVSRAVARRFVQRVDGDIRDFYTGTEVIGSGAELERLLEANPDKRIFIIGSGENQEDGRRYMRAFGIFETLESDRFTVLFIGRDRTTKVWQAAPRAVPSVSTSMPPAAESGDAPLTR